MGFLSILLFLFPTVAYVLWLRAHPGEDLPVGVLAPLLACLALGVGALAWYGLSAVEDRGTAYVPARLEDGVIVRGRAAPPTPPSAGLQQASPR
jgi:hypothetical protein